MLTIQVIVILLMIHKLIKIFLQDMMNLDYDYDSINLLEEELDCFGKKHLN